MNPGNTVSIVYRFHLPRGVEEIPLNFDATDFTLIVEDEGQEREWTKLDFCQCAYCPLVPETTPQCPFARAFARFVEGFDEFYSYDKALIEVVHPNRSIVGYKPLQHGMASLIGLVGATSGCPHLAFFRPMARFHLPFASDEESLFRVFSMFLLGQFLKFGRIEESDMEKLRVLNATASQVNSAMAERLRAAFHKDVMVNAIIILDSFAQSVPYVIRDHLEDLRSMFIPFS